MLDPVIINVVIPVLCLGLPLVLGVAFMSEKQAKEFL